MRLIKTRKWSQYALKGTFLLGAILWLGPLYSQSDLWALSDIFSSWETSHGIHIAYDANRIADLELPAAYAQGSPEDGMAAIKDQFGLCATEERPQHFLLQECTYEDWDLRGLVVDAETGEGLPYATIRAEGIPGGVLADGAGNFHFKLKGQRIANLIVKYIGYHSDTLKIRNGQSDIKVLLAEKDYALSKVEINGLMDVVELEDHFGSIAIETDQLASLPSITGPDPLNSLRLLPGIGGNPESGSGIVMRGSKFDQTMILYDQVPVLQMDHFFGLFSSINQKSIKDIRVFRSGYSAKYSGQAGGLVQITSRDGDSEKIHGGVEIDRNTSGLYFDLPIIKGKWTTALTYRGDNSWIGQERWRWLVTENLLRDRINSSTPGVGDDVTRNADYYFSDLTFKTVLRAAKGHRLTFGVNYNRDDFSNDLIYTDSSQSYSLDVDLASTWRNTGLFIRYDHPLPKDWDASFQLSFSGFVSSTQFYRLQEIRETDTLQDNSGFSQDNVFIQFRMRYDLEKPVSSTRFWRMGIEVPLMTASVQFTQEPDFFGPDTTGLFLPAIYGEHEWSLHKWHLITGLRWTSDVISEQSILEPRVTIRRRLTESMRWRTIYGIYQQYSQQFLPAVREGLVPDFWLLRDSTYYRPLRSHILSTGIAVQKNGWLLDAEVYAKDIRTTTEQFPELSRILPQDSSSLSTYVYGSSQVLGLDLLASRRFNALTFWAGGDLIRTRNYSQSIGELEYQPYYANAASFKTGLLYNIRNWEMGLTWRWQGGRRTTDISAVPTIGQFVPGNVSIPDYHRLDAAVTYRFKFKRFHGSLQNSLFNLYNRRNVRSTQYSLGQGGTLQRMNNSNLGFLYNLKLTVGF